MNHAELNILTNAFAPVIKDYIEQGLRQRDEKIEKLKESLSYAMECLTKLTQHVNELTLKEGPPGKDGAPGIDGKDGAPGKEGPPGKDGRDGMDGINGRDGIDGKDGAPGLDGKDGAPGKDGADGSPGRDGLDGQNGMDGAPGRDGVNGRDGVDGLPGSPGIDGHNGIDGANGKDGADGRDGRDGQPGLNGKDGLGFDHVERLETETQYGFKFVRGTDVKEFLFDKPVPPPAPTLADWHKGVWKAGSYKRGACVTWDGATYVAREDTTTERPANSPKWQMIVKRGDKGRDGKDGKDGARGPEGPRGRDLTQIGPDGQQVHRW